MSSVGEEDKKILKRLGSRANPSASLFRGRLYSQKEKTAILTAYSSKFEKILKFFILLLALHKNYDIIHSKGIISFIQKTIKELASIAALTKLFETVSERITTQCKLVLEGNWFTGEGVRILV